MYRRMNLCLVATAVLAAASVVQAEPLQADRVPAKAQWVVHVDADAARESQVIAAFWQACLDPKAKRALKRLRERWDFNVEQELQSLTFYSTRIGSRRPVAIVHAKLDKKKIVDRFKDSEPQTTEYQGHTIFSWKKKETKHRHNASVAFYRPNLAVVAEDAKLVRSALDVLQGAAPNLKSDSPLAADTPAGTIIVGRAVQLDKNECPCPVLDVLQQVSYVAAEHEGHWTEQMTIVTDSKQVAQRVKDSLQGLLAIITLHFHQHPQIVKLLDRGKVEIKGQRVQASFETPVEPLAQAAPAFCKALREHHKMHKAMRKMKKHD